MDTQKSFAPSAPSNQVQGNSSDSGKRSLVPKGITIGLAVFALILSLAGYGFRLMVGDDVGEVLQHAMVVVPAFMLGIPLFFWLGSRVLNKVKGMHIASWNAISLGYLTSCISLLWLMGTYS
ncbi:hypothetical protein [Psychrobacter sp. LV10R520-6]|uniref:hypothetical protein n=1 Tax=Psychrobacter sp. LV10R520-6 TaxID=1415574 RepID=UPI0024C76E39|nr:hypothetical protein [Psychrobacter sp. LV10R520-6]SNT70527.1 hypothetical protein SAMN04488491_1701 [Psychrobacter sp. LV10R520-6]